MPLPPAVRHSIEELGAKHSNEVLHSRHVADLALKLFDATHLIFGIPVGDRDNLEAACLLHDIGYCADPRRHADAGAEILLRERPAGIAAEDLRRIAALVRLHHSSVRFEQARSTAGRLPDPGRFLYAAALLRIADALDFSHLQDASITSVRATNRRMRVGVRCAHFVPAVDFARRQSGLWREAFPADVEFQLVGSGAHPALVSATLTLHEALRRMLFLNYRVMLVNVGGALEGAGEEPLHDLRIAIRRMRTLLRTFRKQLKGTSAERINEDLQQMNRILGIARDLDVWIGFFSKESVAVQFAGHRLWPRFVAHQLELRRLQQATVRRQLHGPRFTSLKFRIGRFLRVELPAVAAASPSVPLDRAARAALAKSLHRAINLGPLRKSREPEKVHRLRIALRRLRYLGAFFGAALGRPVRKLSRRTHALERVLGGMRDADLALGRILQEGPTPPKLLVRHLERLRRTDAASLESSWTRFEDPAFILGLRKQLKR